MFTFNNETIFTGYIKQLLADFNLPKYKVYTQEDAKYHEIALKHNKKYPKDLWPEESVNIISSGKISTTDNKNNIRYINYIKGNNIERYENNKWVSTNWHYHYNKKELNETKNLVVKSNIYDSYTHEYLGDYLRFQRDYNNLDLMSMYNCFSNNICKNLHIKSTATIDGNKVIKFSFDTDDKNYKIYMIPVKLFKKYTIAIDSAEPVEMCCSFFNEYYAPLVPAPQIEEFTYQRFNSMQFTSPIVYDKLWVSNPNERTNNKAANKPAPLENLSDEEKIKCTQREADLKLFIKLPLNNNSTITVLEGNYRHFNDTVFVINKATVKEINNRSVTNFTTVDDAVPAVKDQVLIPISKLELLVANTGISYPFADRLLEYLLDNVVTPIDDIADNIRRTQKVINTNKNDSQASLTGIWSNSYRHYLYNEIMGNKNIPNENKMDLLGYVDKDTEKYCAAVDKYSKTEFTISNVDIYPDIYKDNKNK